MDQVGLATLLSQPKPVKEEESGLSPLWYGNVVTTAQTTPSAYIKQAPPEEILSEAVCAIAGRALGLPIPKPYLVYDEHGYVTSSEDERLLAMEDARMPPVNWLVQEHDDDALIEELFNWPGRYQTAAWDEWVANEDRNMGNLLFGKGGFTLIDHGRALGAHPPGSPVPHVTESRTNVVAWIISQIERDTGDARSRKKAKELVPYLEGLDFETLAESVEAEEYGMVSRLSEVIDFLQQRITPLPRLVGNHHRQAEMPL